MDAEINIDDVRATYQFLSHSKETEIRAINPNTSSVIPIFVHNEEEFVKTCQQQNGHYNLYAGINERSTGGTSKATVLSVKTIVLDVDPIRKQGFEKDAATEDEMNNAKDAATAIAKFMISQGWAAPRLAMSGNGFQLWIAIPKIEITNDNRDQVEQCLQQFQMLIAEKFNNAIVKVDKIGDLPRIIKIIGTKSIKGKGTDERPHRRAYWYEPKTRVEDAKLKEFILALIPKEKVVKTTPTPTSITTERADIEEQRKHDEKLDKLLRGDRSDYPSWSEFDQALVCKLIYYDRSDSEIDAILSGLPSTWKTKPQHYKDRTVEQAKGLVTDRWKPKTERQKPSLELVELLRNECLEIEGGANLGALLIDRLDAPTKYKYQIEQDIWRAIPIHEIWWEDIEGEPYVTFIFHRVNNEPIVIQVPTNELNKDGEEFRNKFLAATHISLPRLKPNDWMVWLTARLAGAQKRIATTGIIGENQEIIDKFMHFINVARLIKGKMSDLGNDIYLNGGDTILVLSKTIQDLYVKERVKPRKLCEVLGRYRAKDQDSISRVERVGGKPMRIWLFSAEALGINTARAIEVTDEESGVEDDDTPA